VEIFRGIQVVNNCFPVQARKDVLKAFGEAERELKPSPDVLFTDVYDDIPSHLQKQRNEMWATVKAHPDNYPTDKFE